MVEKKFHLVDQTMTTESGCVVSRTRGYNKYINGFGKPGGAVLTYKLTDGCKNLFTKLGLDAVVYEMMIMAARDVLDLSTTYEGSYTASELAAYSAIGGWPMVMTYTNEDYERYDRIIIEAGTLKLSFPTSDVFKMMAEWESVAGITAKKAHRFGCEGKEKPKVEFKDYKRSRGYHKHMLSYAEEERRIAAKYENLGRLFMALSDEGMRKALSVLTAINAAEKLYGNEMGRQAGRAMRRWFWDEYGTCEHLHRQEDWMKREMKRMEEKGEQKSDRYKGMKKELEAIDMKCAQLQQPIIFEGGDFNNAPEVWRQVDDDYAKELLARWKELMADNKAPKWIKKDMYVQFKNQENTVKKWRGKLKVLGIYGEMDFYCKRIDWCASVCTTKGPYDSSRHNVDSFETWVEPEKKTKAKTNTNRTNDSKKTKAVKLAGSEYTVKDDSGRGVVFETYVPKSMSEAKPSPSTGERGEGLTFAEMLRKVLLAA